MWIYAIVISAISVLCSVTASILTARLLTIRYLELLDKYTDEMLDLMIKLITDVVDMTK